VAQAAVQKLKNQEFMVEALPGSIGAEELKAKLANVHALGIRHAKNTFLFFGSGFYPPGTKLIFFPSRGLKFVFWACALKNSFRGSNFVFIIIVASFS
jgi:hypothetical protein